MSYIFDSNTITNSQSRRKKKPNGNDNKLILDVFELKNYQPIIKYKIIVHDGIIMSINNTGIRNNVVSFVIDESIQEYFNPEKIDKLEKLKIKGEVNYKFKIIKWSKRDYFYLNLSNRQQIKLKLKKSFIERLFDFSLNGFWLWLERIGFVIAIMTGTILLFQFLSNNCQRQSPTTPMEKTTNQIDSKINSKDTLNISKSDSLSNKLKD